MIKHVVCYKLKDASLEGKQKVKEMFMSMKDKIEYIQDIAVGLDFLGSERSYDVILEIVFNSKEDMASYQQHPYHLSTVKPFMHAARTASVAVDYEF